MTATTKERCDEKAGTPADATADSQVDGQKPRDATHERLRAAILKRCDGFSGASAKDVALAVLDQMIAPERERLEWSVRVWTRLAANPQPENNGIEEAGLRAAELRLPNLLPGLLSRIMHEMERMAAQGKLEIERDDSGRPSKLYRPL